MKFKIFLRFWLHCVLPLFIGLLIYVSCRTETLLINRTISNFISVSVIGKFTNKIWFIYNLPDGLYSYSLMSSILFLFNFRIGKENLIFIIIGLLFPIIYEVFQYFKIVNGTYDFYDLLFSLLFSILSIILVTNLKSDNYEDQGL